MIRRVGAYLGLAVVAALALFLAWRMGAFTPTAPQTGDESPAPHIPTQKALAAANVPPTPVTFRPSEHGYVGSNACVECHAEIVQRYQSSHSMAHAFAPIGESSIPEEASDAAFRTAGQREYQVETTPEGMRHHERVLDVDGLPIVEQTESVAYTLGSGRRGRSYLIERDGMLFQSPISWYTQEQRWDLSPGYPPANHDGFGRKIIRQCIFCHAGLIDIADADCDRYARPPVVEAGIGCERCHGPGANHVERQHREPLAGHDPTIVNPGRLAAPEREAVCYQCHLRAEFVFNQAGKHSYDFRPGQAYESVWLAFVPAEPRPEELATLVEQSRSSGCFTSSDGRFGCISCHDPHERPQPAKRDDYYRQRCLECHATRGCAVPVETRRMAPQGDSCIACHMPTSKTKGIPHTALTDHRMLRDPTRWPAPNAATPLDPRRLTLLGEAESELPVEQVERAHGLLEATLAAQLNNVAWAQSAETRWNPDRRPTEELLETYAQDAEVLIHLGKIFALTGRPADARAAWSRGLELRPTQESLLRILIPFNAQAGSPSEATQLAQRLVAVDPHVAENHWILATCRQREGDLAGAAQAAEAALARDPTAIAVHQWLVRAYGQLERPQDGRRHADILQRFQGLRATSTP